MSSCVAELDSNLQSMLALKAPGVTGTKISGITALCNANIQSEDVLVQRLYTHFKRTPATHKLGVLYVVDSVTRSWVDSARRAGQAFGPSAPDGTFAAGVNRVTELLQSFMTDIITSVPEEQKIKIVKLVDIWERGTTFPSAMLSSFKQKLSTPVPNDPRSTTPTGSPPKDFIPLNETNGNNAAAGAASAPAPDTSQLLKALAEIAKTNATGTGMPSQASSSNVSNFQSAFPQNVPPVNPASSVPLAAQAVNVPGAANGANPFGQLMSSANYAQGMPNAQTGMQANPMMPQQNISPQALQLQLQVIQLLQAQGVPQDQWAAILQVVTPAAMAGGVTGGATQPGWQANNGRDDLSRDRNGYSDSYNVRSPSGRFRDRRSRSRSPGGYNRRREASPPRRRDSPVYGDFGRGGSRRQGAGGGRSGEYRQRSPQDRYRRSDSPRGQDQKLPPPGPKFLDYDRSLPPNHIKVLSRTLFVGGVTSSEEVLRGIFAQYGLVQTCIVNVDKRHAFVKMLTRKDAMQAKEGMERYKSADMQLRTRWGVGFGPRDCSDYQTGISIIPIDRLTDADRKWMLTAEYGGTGGKDIDPGMVAEEPDIEIGAGVSSKAISRRMQTDKGGQQGPRSTRDGPSNQQPPSQQRYRQPEFDNRDANPIGVAPAVPAFGGFQFPNNFQLPPGFVMPNLMPNQPPPPGAS